MEWRYGIWVVVPFFLASCASVQGIPAGLSDANQTQLATQNLQQTLNVALDLKKTYEAARDENLKYIYWSNVPFFPLAAAAAGDIYAKRISSLASIGIIAGTLAGFNSFTNARPNAKAYQAGINALVCVYTKLGGYSNRSAEGQFLSSSANLLAGTHVPAAEAALASAQNLDLNSTAVANERAANGTVMSTLASVEKALSQAIGDAQKAVAGARAELSLFDNLPSFSATSIIQIDSIVASKITVTDVNYAALVSSISGTMSAPKPAAPGGAASMPFKPAVAGAFPATPLADAIKEMQNRIAQLQLSTAALSEATSKFGLTAREQEVGACVKNM